MDVNIVNLFLKEIYSNKIITANHSVLRVDNTSCDSHQMYFFK